MITADYLIVGGGIAGLSAAAALAPHGRTVLLEAEDALGFHSSGRSATFAHYGIGNATVRGLTASSRGFFLDPADGFADAPIASLAGALFIARSEMIDALAALERNMRPFSDAVRPVTPAQIAELCPILRLGEDAIVAGLLDESGLKLDGNALLHGYAKQVRAAGGEIRTGAPVTAVRRSGSDWVVETPAGAVTAPVLVNAAGAWADRVAALAGVRPLGLEPKRRTIIVVDPPEGMDVRRWPFVKTATDEFYMLPEAGRLLASPVDEEADEPCDAQPDDYGIALAAHRLEEYTTLSVPRIAHRWAGLRTFAPDRVPLVGFAPDAPGFFWLAGQGGYGLQTAPALAACAASLITGAAWPDGLAALGVEAEQLAPDRFSQAG